jgi:hypothetical protein
MATTLDEDFQQHMNWMQLMISDPRAAANAASSITRFSSQVEDLIARSQVHQFPRRLAHLWHHLH